MTRSHVSLFAGVDAIGIASAQLGYETTACVEGDPYCQAILRLRCPGAAIFDDVRTIGAAELGTGMDLLSGGFPCQDLSSAGLGAGLNGARSGLWTEYLRIIRECSPRMVLIENVAVLKSRGLDVVVAGLLDAGYGCWWDCIPALAVGAPHLRDRIWITAVPLEDFPHHAFQMTDRVNGKMPRAGCCNESGVFALAPAATIKDCKVAMGAVKRPDGVTWLSRIDQPLFPTPTVGDARNSRNATAGRTPGGNHHSGTTLSDHVRLWPTPERSDGTGGRVSLVRGGQRPSGVKRAITLGTAVAHAQPLYPTPSAASYGSNQGGAAGRVGPVRHSLMSMAGSGDWPRLYPTPRRSDGERGGRGDLIQIVRENKTISSHGDQPTERNGNSAGGGLNPDFVEWLMGLPIGWTDVDCAEPIHRDWLTEHGLPRTARDVPHRKQRLQSIGNSLVWRVAWMRIAQAHRLLDIASAKNG